MTTVATERVVLVAPSSVDAAVRERLARSGGTEAVAPDQVSGEIDALVFMPRGPARGAPHDREHAAAARLAANAGHTVLVSSAAAYGATPYGTGDVDETWAPPTVHTNTIAEWWLALEREVMASARAGRVTVLRAAPVLDGESYVSRLLRGAAAVTIAGHDPTIQLLSVEDLAAAVEGALTRRAAGVFNVAPAGVMPLRAALRAAGVWRIPAPRILQRGARAALAPAGLAWSADQVDFLRYSGTISGARAARDLGFVPKQTSAEAVDAFVRAHAPRRARPAAGRTFDRFGQDPAYIDWYNATLFSFMRRYYWRIEAEGLAYVPASGPAIIAGPHRGFMPFDGVMLLHLIARARQRYVRFLIHPSLMKFPFLFDFMTKLGGIPACRENADWTLARGELAGVFPEGIHGAFTPYRRAYRLGKFGRDEFVRMALRNRAPIVPFAIVGSAEIFPILAKIRWPWWERWTEWPYFPITPTFPLAPVPLPSKWHVRFLEPLPVDGYPSAAADDPRVVREISGLVRERIQAALDDMLARRRSIFFGSKPQMNTDEHR